jgi:hypothetical protein
MGIRSINKKNGTAVAEKQAIKFFEINIDYPQTNEIIMPGHYAIRISGAPQTNVDVSINGGEWKPCRPDVGFYWLDWWAEPGDVKLVARFQTPDKEWKKSKERKVVVAGPGKN